MKIWSFFVARLAALVYLAWIFHIKVLQAAEAEKPIELPRVIVTDTAIAPTPKPERLYDESEAREAIERTPGGVAVMRFRENRRVPRDELKGRARNYPRRSGAPARSRHFGRKPDLYSRLGIA